MRQPRFQEGDYVQITMHNGRKTITSKIQAIKKSHCGCKNYIVNDPDDPRDDNLWLPIGYQSNMKKISEEQHAAHLI